MDQRVINLYDTFTHGGMSRRDFLDRLTGLTGSAAAAVAILPLLRNNYAQAAIVAADDPRLVAERVAYDSPKGKINGYLVRPTAKGKRPAIIVIHENRGLNPHIEDVARRLAVEGFLVLAPDLLSVSGGTPPDEDKVREVHGKTDPKDITAAATAAVPFLLTHPESNGNVGVVAFASAAALPIAWRRKGPSSKPWRLIMGCRFPRIRCRRFVRRYCCTTPDSTNGLMRASPLTSQR
jgi:carboxymethylenebutenolidase